MHPAQRRLDRPEVAEHFEYDIVVLNSHLLDQEPEPNVHGKPGTDDNQDFGVAFADAYGQFKVFAHFTLDYV